ncbi:MAG: hypothetical protein ABGW97_16890 [Christiangramia sp.]|uniref:hypothetical protein n=1 Tax=Christiangramia sp. TaxID=1931228 RepID=UPI003241CFBC
MQTKDQKIIFLNSYLPRTGHNFAAEVIKIFSDHQVLINPRSETKISTLLESYFLIYENGILNKANRDFFDHLFINDLRKRILCKSDKNHIMIKDTSFVGVDYLPEVFPGDIHLILIRDPLNVFLSLLKAMNLNKRSYRNFLKKILLPVGIYPYFYSKKLSRQVLDHFPELNNRIVLRYEDLVMKNKTVLRKLQKIFNSESDIDEIKLKIDQIKVINSSFFEETKGLKIWDMQSKTKEYDPLKRKSRNYFIRKGVELGSRQLRKKLNYI